ncbi:MAG TPA: hypothetical protein EYQ00_06430 [Dehalococcoidia bacterium]|nr:hypothetical protein [Dehalococcoidia bacterium]
MSQAYITCEESSITFTVNGAPRCGANNQEWTIIVDPSQAESFVVDPATAATFVGSGFFILLPLWAAIYGCRVLVNTWK